MNKSILLYATRPAGVVAFGAALLLSAATTSHAQKPGEDWHPGDPLPVFKFDGEGTLEDYGWTIVQDGVPTQSWAVRPRFFDGSPDVNDQLFPHVGSHAVFQANWANRDASHTTIWLRSPEFKLTGEGDLTAWLIGGGGSWKLPEHETDVPVTTAVNGFLCLVLRNAATGDFVLGERKPGGHPWPSIWEEVTFSSKQLAELDQDAVYTLDLIDQREGWWGWVGMDHVTIPGTSVPAESQPEP